jgi:hypothetical protein
MHSFLVEVNGTERWYNQKMAENKEFGAIIAVEGEADGFTRAQDAKERLAACSQRGRRC